MAVSHLSEDEQTLIEVLREIALEKVVVPSPFRI